MTPVRAIVVVPTYNEHANLPVLVNALMQQPGLRLLVADDQSPDGTGELADSLARERPGRIDVLHRTGRRGLGRAYVDGFQRAIQESVDVVCQMDADLSHDPRQLPLLIDAAAHADVVIGSRYIPGGRIVNWPKHREVLSRFANVYVRAITRLKTQDCTAGYRCWRRETLARLPLERFISDGYSFQIETLFTAARLGCRIVEVPITFIERQEGQSKVSRGVLIESAVAPWRLVFKPFRAIV